MFETCPFSLFSSSSPKRMRRVSTQLQLALKLAILAICSLIAFGGHYPPAHAQHRQTEIVVPVLTVKDAQQDDKLAEIDKHLEATDARVTKMADSITTDASEISGLKGEERGIGAVLGIMSLVQIVVQVRGKKDE